MKRRELDCEEVIEQIFAYLDRELDSRTLADIERHLESCRECFSRAEFEKRLRRKVADSASTKAPRRLHARIRALLDEF